MTDWTAEEDEAFNEVEKNSNLGKQILKDMGQPYHWETDAIKAAIKIEREACAQLRHQLTPFDLHNRSEMLGVINQALDDYQNLIRARGNT
jgi:hypothetical protein